MDAWDTVQFHAATGVELTVSSVGSVADADRRLLPVLLLHGLSQQREFWRPVVRRLRTRPVAMLDQRGHGDSDTGLDVDYSIPAIASDARAALDRLGWDRAVVVGHSWGAAVAIALAASVPDRISAVGLLDGGLWSPSDMGPRDEVRVRLTPPALGIPEDDLWALIRAGDLGPTWSDEVQAALAPTFTTDDAGQIRTRLGMDRHMAVLDGMLDYHPQRDLQRLAEAGLPVWAVQCVPREPDELQRQREEMALRVAAEGDVLVHRWAGAVHDVPLQWPALVAGFIDALVESREGGAG
jgi:pimeloyl-ACP methyl ester carboxylesterase